MQVHQPLQGQLLCATCNQAFSTVQLYKQHYKSDFHRYNIKRKTFKLPPVTYQQFSTKQQEIKQAQNPHLTCNECRKTFASINTLKQHAESKGHNPTMMVQPKEKVVRTAAVFGKNSKRCLFCCRESSTLEENLRHMSLEHSFFVAQQDFCKNVKGLVEYLQEKIQVGFMCLTCENKGAKDFQSGDAVRKHMTSKGHTFMKTENGFEQYEKFYDFTALFEEKLKEQNQVVPGIEYQKVKVYVDDEETKQQESKQQEDGDQEWEDQDESEGSQDQEWEDQEGSEENEKEIKEEKKKLRIKTYHIMKPTVTANDQLLLPNGKILGHRKYRHIYRQTIRLPNYFSSQLKMLANGQHGSSALSTLYERRHLLEAAKYEKMAFKSIKREKKGWLNLGMANNTQHHYRCQNSL